VCTVRRARTSFIAHNIQGLESHTERTSIKGREKRIEERRIWWGKLICKGEEQRKEEEKDENGNVEDE
jgi:hypothetical protein